MAQIASDTGNATRNHPSAKVPAQAYLTNCKSLYSCIYCRTHLANHDELVSRSFQGNHGRAYLFNAVINVSCGPAVQRQLNTGSHAVADIFCANCATTLGWKYERAYVETQKYKEGKYIIELAHVVRENRHLELDKGQRFLGTAHATLRPKSNPPTGECHAGSLSPPSSTKSSSQASSSPNEDDDEELMFPFYDDLLCTIDRSSYSSSLSNSHHNRLRRTLYLDSTPYDWKHSTSDASASPAEISEASGSEPYVCGSTYSNKQPTSESAQNSSTSSPLASSIGLSDISPSTSLSRSSSSDILSENQNKQSYQYDNKHARNSHDPHETQFEFEADTQPEPCALDNRSERANDEKFRDHCDLRPNKAAEDHTSLSQSSANGTLSTGKLVSGSAHDIRQVAGGASATVSGGSIECVVSAGSTAAAATALVKLNISAPKKALAYAGDNYDNASDQVISPAGGCLSTSSSISLDDEQFYDCCADHEAYELVQPQH